MLPRSTGAAEDFTWGRERFVAEGRTLASLQDAPAIVRVFDFLEANGTAYIVMELLHGETLEQRLKRDRSAEAGRRSTHPVAAARRAGAGARRGLPASRHQAGQHPAR